MTGAANAAPIGIFDSGLGGLSILGAVRAFLPAESVLYCADSRYAPYGLRDDDFIVDRSEAITRWLLGQGAKAIVVACNTATAHAVHLLRARFNVPLVGVEPGVKPAAAASASGVAGVLATAGTLRSLKFQRLLAEHADRCRFLCQPGYGLVEAVERGETDSPAVEALLREYLAPMVAGGADTLVLGCTHYPFLIDAVRRAGGDRLTLIDTGVAISRQLMRLLDLHGNAAPADARPTVRLCSTADGGQLGLLARRLLDLPAHVEAVTIHSRQTAGNTTPDILIG
jgi:glutamate racemase